MNRPLKLGEIKLYDRIWDNQDKRYVVVTYVDHYNMYTHRLSFKFVFIQDGLIEVGLLYDTKRFYRKEVCNE